MVVAGGVESISMPNPGFGGPANMDPKLEEMYPAIYMAMIETADCGDEHRRWPTGTVPTGWLLKVGLPRGPRSLRVPIQDSIQVFRRHMAVSDGTRRMTDRRNRRSQHISVSVGSALLNS